MVDIIKCPDGRITPEMIDKVITPRTQVVALSAVQFLSGYRADLATIGQMCRDRKIWFIVDGIQAVGAVQLDVKKMNIDGLAAGAQKWQMSVQGTGFLYVNEALQEAVQPQFVGWLGVQDAWDFYNYGQPLAATAKRYEGGTVNHAGFSGMAACLSFLLEQGGRCHRRTHSGADAKAFRRSSVHRRCSVGLTACRSGAGRNRDDRIASERRGKKCLQKTPCPKHRDFIARGKTQVFSPFLQLTGRDRNCCRCHNRTVQVNRQMSRRRRNTPAPLF